MTSSAKTQDGDADPAPGDDIHALSIARSVPDQVNNPLGTMSGIENTTNVAAFPRNLSPQELQLWKTSCSSHANMAIDELVVAVKACQLFC